MAQPAGRGRRLTARAVPCFVFCLALALIAGPVWLADAAAGAGSPMLTYAAQPSPSPSPSGGAMMGKAVTVTLTPQGAYSTMMGIEGSATIDPESGSVVVLVMGLPNLSMGDTYMGWLVNTSNGQMQGIGELEPAGGMGAYSANVAMAPMSGGGYNAFVVTRESMGRQMGMMDPTMMASSNMTGTMGMSMGGMNMGMMRGYTGEIVMAGFFPGTSPGALPTPIAPAPMMPTPRASPSASPSPSGYRSTNAG